MMNIDMMFWAAENGGNRLLYDLAVTHAKTTMNNQFRPDGSCYHVAVYDTINGDLIKGVTHQGYADNSMWARGQSWAIYGYTMVYRYTHNKMFLDFALQSLAQLSTPKYQSGKRNVAFLMHSTGHHPAGSEIDASIIYADYYYLEALMRAKKL